MNEINIPGPVWALVASGLVWVIHYFFPDLSNETILAGVTVLLGILKKIQLELQKSSEIHTLEDNKNEFLTWFWG